MITDDGQQLGVMPTSQALKTAQDQGLDLVEVGPKAQPPVAKIVNFGKLQYQKEKQERKNRAKSRKSSGETKGIRLSTNIGEHDMMVRVNAGRKFLDKGHRIKPELQLRGREKAHPELAKETLERYVELLDMDVSIDQPVSRQGWRFSTIVSNKKN